MSRLQFGPYLLDIRARQLSRAGRELHLEPKVMDLLLFLSQRTDRCVTKRELREALWPEVSVSEASIYRLVKELRKALGEPETSAVLIRKIYGRGYQLVACADVPEQTPNGSRRLSLAPEPVAAPPRPSVDDAQACVSSSTLVLGPRLSQVLAPLRRAAGYAVPIVVEGEIGTGKSRVAESLHDWSGRCGAALFLRCPGATEAELDGLLTQAACAGTSLVLDEVGELNESLQRRLVGALSAQSLADPASLARRTIATSQHSLSLLVERGRFRLDLLARLSGVRAELPPLRERREEVLLLAQHFLARAPRPPAADLPAALAQRLLAHDWPLNVRELELHMLGWLALSGQPEARPSEPTAGPAQRRAGLQPGECVSLGVT